MSVAHSQQKYTNTEHIKFDKKKTNHIVGGRISPNSVKDKNTVFTLA